MKILYLTYSGVASRKDITLYDAALFLGPRVSVRVGCAGSDDSLNIGAAWRILPAIAKLLLTDYHSMGPCGEVVVGIVVVVATQPAHLTLKE